MGKFKGKAVIILEMTDNFIGIYLDGKLHDQGRYSFDFMYMLELAEKYSFTAKDVKICEVSEVDERLVDGMEGFPTDITKLNDYLEYIK